jgi:hypothetical protein
MSQISHQPSSTQVDRATASNQATIVIQESRADLPEEAKQPPVATENLDANAGEADLTE